NDSIYFQPAGTGVNYFTKDIVALDSVRLPNFILKSDTTSFKPVVMDANGNLFKNSFWPASNVSGATWGTITGTLSAQTDLQTALNAKYAQSGKAFGATAIL